MSQDISLGRGDTAPVPTWAVALDPTGTIFELAVMPPRATPLIRRSDTGGLAVTRDVDGSGVISATVTWPVLASESAALPLGRLTPYTLRCYGAVGDIRYTAAGFLVMTDGPVSPSTAQVQIAGLPGPEGGLTQGFAGAVISGHRVVKGPTGGVLPCDAGTLSDAGLALGVALNSAQPGGAVSIRSLGVITDPSLSLVPNAPVFCGPNGALTQSVPASPAAAFLLQVGRSLSATSFFVSLQPPVELA